MSDRPLVTSRTAPESVDELPPSAKLVLTVLEREGDLTQSRLADETMLPSRTVRYALKRLEELDLVTSRISFSDARQRVYSLNGERFAESTGR